MKVYDPINAMVYNQNFSMTFAANETKVQPISLPITEGLRDGTYLISVEVNKDEEKIGTSSGVFEVQNVKLGIIANLPSGINHNTSTNISFLVTNNGIIDVVNAPLRIMLKDASNNVVWQETKQFNIGVGANTSVQFTIPSFNLNFGKYTMSYNIEYGAKTILGIETLNSSNSVSINFDKVIYGVRDAISMNLGITNTGRFNEIIGVNVRSEAIGLDDTKSVNILAGQSVSLPYSSVIPEAIEAGTHSVVVTLSAGNSVTQTFNFTMYESKLVASLDKVEYAAEK